MARGRSNNRAYKILNILTNSTKRKNMIIEDYNHKLIYMNHY